MGWVGERPGETLSGRSGLWRKGCGQTDHDGGVGRIERGADSQDETCRAGGGGRGWGEAGQGHAEPGIRLRGLPAASDPPTAPEPCGAISGRGVAASGQGETDTRGGAGWAE